jgi:hypothetical protein
MRKVIFRKIMMYHVIKTGDCWQLRGPIGSVEISSHTSKTDAISHAQEMARVKVGAHVIIHNDDGTADYLEHGFGDPIKMPPELLASASGSTFQRVEESVDSVLSRGVQAVFQKGKAVIDIEKHRE